MKLTPDDLSELEFFNDCLFLANDQESQIDILQGKIAETRKMLLDLLGRLEKLKRQPRISVVSKSGLRSFFAAHPAMSVEWDERKDTLRLLSKNQSVSFHTRRERNAVARNNDIIYATLPLYGFTLEFYQDGAMRGRSEKSGPVSEAFSGRDINYGHPHTTRNPRNWFVNVCVGNNRFNSAWHSMRNGGALDGDNVLLVLSQAAIWLESANISDMYGGSLAANAYIPEDTIAVEEIDDLFFGRAPGSESPGVLRFIHDSNGQEIYRRALWPVWLWKHFSDLPEDLIRCQSLLDAARVDSFIVLKCPEIFGELCSVAADEMERTTPIVNRCYAELGGYYSGYSAKSETLAQACPEIFGVEINA